MPLSPRQPRRPRPKPARSLRPRPRRRNRRHRNPRRRHPNPTRARAGAGSGGTRAGAGSGGTRTRAGGTGTGARGGSSRAGAGTEDLPRRRSVRARADRGDQRLAPPCPRNARLCRSANPRPVRRPRVIHKHATPAVPRGAAEPQIPIAPPRRRTLTVPRFPPLEAFGRRPSGPHLRPRQGRHPKPYEKPSVRRRR